MALNLLIDLTKRMGGAASTIKEPQNSVAIAQNSLPVTNAKMSRANITHAKIMELACSIL